MTVSGAAPVVVAWTPVAGDKNNTLLFRYILCQLVIKYGVL